MESVTLSKNHIVQDSKVESAQIEGLVKDNNRDLDTLNVMYTHTHTHTTLIIFLSVKIISERISCS